MSITFLVALAGSNSCFSQFVAFEHTRDRSWDAEELLLANRPFGTVMDLREGILLWPYVGLALGVILTSSLLTEHRGPINIKFMAKTALPMYILHQFEEHGIDLYGRRYAFQEFFCNVLGYPVQECPGDDWFILAVNVAGVWLALGICSIYWNRPRLLAASYGLVLVNTAAHIAPAIKLGKYNPGLLTAVALFLPVGVATYLQLHKQKNLTRREMGEAIAVGVLMHVFLIVSLVLRASFLSHAVFIGLQMPLGALPFVYSLLKGEHAGNQKGHSGPVPFRMHF